MKQNKQTHNLQLDRAKRDAFSSSRLPKRFRLFLRRSSPLMSFSGDVPKDWWGEEFEGWI